jgi:NAD(P)-dependent dehydrogenase (short-subunit alcohol dehydrogenase family)
VKLDGTVSIVTGGGSGLGAGTARHLAARGATVVVLDRDLPAAQAVAADIGGHAVGADVSDPEEVQAAVDLAEDLGELRSLVNCAGISRAARTVSRAGEPFDLTRFEFVLRVNLVGTFNCLRLAAAAMARLPELPGGERGAIVNTASAAAFEGQVGQAAYSASKAGVVGMTLPIARDLAGFGIRVNTIAPGMFETPIFGPPEQARAFRTTLEPNLIFPKRFGDVREFAELAEHMISNCYLNGEVVRLDGAARLAPR